MSGHVAFEIPRALRSNDRPQTPVVDAARVRKPVKAPAQKQWSQPKVDDKGFIPPKPVRPQDFEEPTATPIRRLIAMVAGVSWVSARDITCARRDERLVKARQIVFWLAKQHTNASYPMIGRHVGDRDHSTAMYGVRRVQAVIDRLNIQVVDCPVTMAERLWFVEWPRVSR